MRAFWKQRDRGQQLVHSSAASAMTEHRQAESGLGDEDIARHHLERRAGRVGGVLVVAGGDDAGILAETAICAEPSTWPAGWNVILTSPRRIVSP